MSAASDKRVQACYDIDDNGAAFSCVKDAVRASAAEECAPQIVMLVRDGCAPCEEEQETRRQDLESGAIQKVDWASERGKRIAELNAIDFTPAVLILDCHDRVIEPAAGSV